MLPIQQEDSTSTCVLPERQSDLLFLTQSLVCQNQGFKPWTQGDGCEPGWLCLLVLKDSGTKRKELKSHVWVVACQIGNIENIQRKGIRLERIVCAPVSFHTRFIADNSHVWFGKDIGSPVILAPNWHWKDADCANVVGPEFDAVSF